MDPAILVLVAYCSLASGECGLATQTPNGRAFASLEECRARAKFVDGDMPTQTKLFNVLPIVGPWTAHAICGTEAQATEIKIMLAMQAAEQLRDAEPEPEPGERPPPNEPNGG